MHYSRIIRHLGAVTLLGTLFCIPGTATSVLFTGSNGNLMGSANFVLIGDTLTIELKNTASVKANAPSQVLIGIFFDLAGNPVTNLQSIAVDSSSSIVNCVSNCGPGTLVDTNFSGFNGGWQYLSGINNASTGDYGVGTAGFGIFNGTATGGGGGCAGNQQFCFGLIPTAGTDHVQLNTKQFIQSGIAVTLKITNLPANYDIRDAVSGLRLQYGTSLTEPSITTFERYPGPDDLESQGQVPEPSTYALMGFGLLGLGLLKRRKA